MSEVLIFEEISQSHLEVGLPDHLDKALRQMKESWEKLDRGEKDIEWDCNWCELYSSINVAEVDEEITPRQAKYLRDNYLRMEKEEI